MSDLENAQFIKMTQTPVQKLVVSLAVPTVISMLITSIYNMADTFFVSKLGTSASAAVGIVFSIMAIIQAIGFTLGMGSGSLISRFLGKRDAESANRYASAAFTAALSLGTCIALFGNIFIDRLMILLGASSTILPFARNYACFILMGAPLMCASFVMNNILRSEGKASFSMIGLTTGGILNMLLDPFFIFVLKLGTSGAAIATIISQAVSFSIMFQFFLRKKSITRISLKYIPKDAYIYVKIISTGLPSLFRQGLASISSVLLNRGAGVFGDAAIAAMSIVNRLVMTVASTMVGIGQGFAPVSGYNYGAKNYNRVKEAYWFTVKLGFAVLMLFALIYYFKAQELIYLFRDDINVVKVGSAALKFQAIGLPFHAFIIGTNMLMQSTGKIKQAAFLSCNRQGVYFIPFIIVLPTFIGLLGVEISQACADILSFITAIPYVIWFMKTLRQEAKAVV